MLYIYSEGVNITGIKNLSTGSPFPLPGGTSMVPNPMMDLYITFFQTAGNKTPETLHESTSVQINDIQRCEFANSLICNMDHTSGAELMRRVAVIPSALSLQINTFL